MQTRILVFAGSHRSGSLNTRLAGTVTKELATANCEVTRISLADYELPLYDGDHEMEKGVPENAVKLAKLMAEHDGFFIVSPEYNGSLSPLLKNALDWVSRVKSEDDPIVPFRGKTAAIGACSPGKFGGKSMLGHLRDILVQLGVLVVSEQIAVGDGGSAFDNMDELTDERAAGILKSACASLVQRAGY